MGAGVGRRCCRCRSGAGSSSDGVQVGCCNVAAVVATSRGGCWLQVSGMVLLVLGRRRWRARSSLEGDAGAWQKCGDAAAADGLQVTDAAR